jgi:kynurenine formamidase
MRVKSTAPRRPSAQSRPAAGSRRAPPLVAAALVLACVCAGCRSDTPIVKDMPIVKGLLPAPPFPQGWRVVDLTLPLDATAPHLAHPRQFPFERVELGPAVKGAPRTGQFTAMEHMGTHLAAPRTRMDAGTTIDGFGGQDLLLPLAVIDVAADAASESNVGEDAVRADERARGAIPQGAAVVLRTRTGPRATVHAGWGPSSVKWLVKERGARVLGSDAPTLGSSAAERDTAQATAAAAGVWSVVSLDHLESVPCRGAFLVIGALPIVGASGAPARVIALVPPDAPPVAPPKPSGSQAPKPAPAPGAKRSDAPPPAPAKP